MAASTESSYERIAMESLGVITDGNRWLLELAEQFRAIEVVLTEARWKEDRRGGAKTGEGMPEHLSSLLRYGSVNPEKLAGAGRTLAHFHAAAFKRHADALIRALPESDER